MKLTSFTRGFWESAVQCNGAKESVLRDYDIVKLKESGKTIGQIAIKFGITERYVIKILDKYR